MASPDQRALFSEYVVGANHPSLADTANRLCLVDHANSGAHKALTRDDLTSTDGGTLTVGMVVIQDTTAASSVKRTTTPSSTQDVYVVVESSIASADTGRVAYGGFATVNVQGAVAVGDYLRTSSTTGRAASAGTTAAAGIFGRAYTANVSGAGTVTAQLFPVVAAVGITSLNGLTGATQTFVDETNLTIVSSGTTHTLAWASTLSAARGGTGLGTYAVGDLIYASATTPTLAKLAAVATGSVLVSAGVNTAPAYSASPSLTGLTLSGNLTLATASVAGISSDTRLTFTAANGAVNALLLSTASNTQTSGTASSWKVAPTFAPSSTSTMVAIGVYINPTINYSAGTPGAGSYVALQIDAVETALPTGTNYLIRARAGAAGTTDKFTVTNAGTVTTGTWQGTAVAGLYGGTGLTTAAVGDLIYASATTPTWSRLAAVAAGRVLASNGTSTAPFWAVDPVFGEDASSHSMTLWGSESSGGGVFVGLKTGSTFKAFFGFASAIYGGSYDDDFLVVAQGSTTSGGRARFRMGGIDRLTIGPAGVQVGAPTGGDKGAGTVNSAGDHYKNNTAYANPDYVLEHWATGSIVRFADREGAGDYTGLRPLRDVEAFTREHYTLPLIHAWRTSDRSKGVFGGGDAVLATLEESYLYLFDHEREIAALRARLAELEARRD